MRGDDHKLRTCAAKEEPAAGKVALRGGCPRGGEQKVFTVGWQGSRRMGETGGGWTQGLGGKGASWAQRDESSVGPGGRLESRWGGGFIC